MLAIKAPSNNANRVKEMLITKNLLDKNYKIMAEKEYIYFPITKKIKGYEIVNKQMERFHKPMASLKENLKGFLTRKEMERVKTAYDIIGDIAILEIDKDLRKKEKRIAQTLLKLRKDVKTVLRKSGAHGGEFRVQKLKYLAGEKKKETIHKENNCLLKLNPEEVYFSPRLCTERKRISELVKKSKKIPGKKEDILVMFSGCAPYCVAIGKNAKENVNLIIGIEINPIAHKYGVENLKLNKLTNVSLIKGDVRKIIPQLVKLNRKFDRILMPLPKNAEDFLQYALYVSKKGTIIHFYDFLHEDKFNLAKEKIRKVCKKANKRCKILDIVKCGQHSPRVYRICVDFKVE